MRKVIRAIRRVAGADQDHSSTDELLQQFFATNDEYAFECLVRRYGPMVYGVCLRILRNPQDAEDAFQATFLMLVRKGRSIRRRSSLSSWLYRVAYRLALTQRNRIQRRLSEDLKETDAVTGPVDPAWLELRSALDEEVQRLPSYYRSVLVLCALEGKTYEDAARELGCPRATVAVRLLRARQMLKKRLVRRGLIVAGAAVIVESALPNAVASVPGLLIASTVAAAAAFASGVAVAGLVPFGVVTLLKSATREYWLEKCRIATVVLASVGLASAGASASTQMGYVGAVESVPKCACDLAGGTVRQKSRDSAPPDAAADNTTKAAIELKGPGMTLNLNPATKS
jgi:RNA polymerase sigma factor (sigma-70 family)